MLTKIAENGRTIILSHVLANDYNKPSVTQNGCRIWRTQLVRRRRVVANSPHLARLPFWRWIAQAEYGT
jgi:hypothetical protein